MKVTSLSSFGYVVVILLFVLTCGQSSTILESVKKELKQEGITNIYASLPHDKYLTYQQIITRFHAMKARFPDNVEMSYLNHRTWENRKVMKIKLSTPSSDNTKKKPAIILESGTHAREWIGPVAHIYFVEKLLENYWKGDKTARKMLNQFDWHLVPVNNVDGYLYTWKNESTRYWRINRNTCGTDINRNFDVAFASVGVSEECGTGNYPGKYAFSEPESKNIRDLYLSLEKEVKAFVSIHAFGQFIIIPRSYINKTKTASNYKELMRVGGMMKQSIKDTTKATYQLGETTSTINYLVSGSSMDWVEKMNPKVLSYTMELRPEMVLVYSNFHPTPVPNIALAGKDLYAAYSTLALNIR